MNKTNKGWFIKTPVINDVMEIHQKKLKRGQWIQLAWCDKPSRLHDYNYNSLGYIAHVTAFHYPGAHSRFVSYVKATKA